MPIVRVPVTAGPEIVNTAGDGTVRRFPVAADGTVTLDNQDDADLLLFYVQGAEAVEDTPPQPDTQTPASVQTIPPTSPESAAQ